MRTLRLLPALILAVACDGGGKDSEDEGGGETAGDAGATCYDDNPAVHEGVAADSIMETWGHACEIDADCTPLLGEGAICEHTAVIYTMPGGYCTKLCALPDFETTFVADDPACDPNGGVYCIGQMGTFERCAVPCTGSNQCARDGYMCRTMPDIGQPADPMYCLMDNCCLDGCEPDPAEG